MNEGTRQRWRLVLGAPADAGLGAPCLDEAAAAQDDVLDWLYGRDHDPVAGDAVDRDVRRPRGAGREGSRLTVPQWINEVHRLFPKETIERIERDAVERYRITEVVTDPEALRRIQPSVALLEAVLHVKHLMNPEVLALAREIVSRVVGDLMAALATEVQAAFGSVRQRRRPTPWKSLRDFDAPATIRRNLRHWSADEQRLYIERPLFTARTRRHQSRWQIILLVDQSGSMAASVIHSAVTAACFWGVPALKTHLCVFDMNVVDLTDQITDPVEALMKVQLGGGTDIARAVDYAAGLIENPRRTIVVLISDFLEGGQPALLVHRIKALCDQGTHVLGVAALDADATPDFDRDMARRLVDVGAHVAALTPGELAAWVAERIRT